MKFRNNAIGYAALGVIVSLGVSATAILLMGAGHSPHVEFWIGLFKFALIAAAVSMIAFIVLIIVKMARGRQTDEMSDTLMDPDIAYSPKQCVRNFIQDNYEWEHFVQTCFDFETGDGRPEVQAKWEALLDRYCMPGKRGRDGASMTNTIHHLPEDEYIVEEKIEGETAIVSTEVRWKNGYRKGEVEPYEYEFMRLNGTWVLNQIYLLAPRGRFECI